MRRIEDLERLAGSLGASVIKVGKFFAVHVGHQALIRATVERARARGVASVVLTFDRHPQELLRPGTTFPLLTSLEERLGLIEALGVDVTAVVCLDMQFLGQTPETFARRVLREQLGAVEVVASGNFRFGRGAQGTVETLRELGGQMGFEVTVLPPVLVDGVPVSSTRVKECLVGGDVETAAALLDRLYDVPGEVVSGDRRGRELGFPT